MAKIILFEHDYYDGKALILTGDAHRLQDFEAEVEGGDWNDVTSSIIVISGEWTVYDNSEYGGARHFVSAGGGPEHDGCYPQARYWNGPNDELSSVRVGYDY